MKYIGKLLLEGIVISAIAGVVLFGLIYLMRDKIMELLSK